MQTGQAGLLCQQRAQFTPTPYRLQAQSMKQFLLWNILHWGKRWLKITRNIILNLPLWKNVCLRAVQYLQIPSHVRASGATAAFLRYRYKFLYWKYVSTKNNNSNELTLFLIMQWSKPMLVTQVLLLIGHGMIKILRTF